MKAMGRHIAATLAREPLPVRLQVIGVEDDNSVSNDRVVELVAAHTGTGAMTACFYPEGVPHSMFSRYDHPGEDMYWLEDFNTAAIAFITAGAAFPASERPRLQVRECRLDGASASG